MTYPKDSVRSLLLLSTYIDLRTQKRKNNILSNVDCERVIKNTSALQG